MRVALYGGMANDMYLIASALAGAGVDVRFIRDHGHCVPFGQPLWQDCPFILDGDAAHAAFTWGMDKWRRVEAEQGWEPPAWLVDPANVAPIGDPVGLGMLDRTFLQAVMRRRPYLGSALSVMRDCDLVIANGLDGTALALASGKPFVIWPYGADIRFAAALGPQDGGGVTVRAQQWFWRRIMRRAYARAQRVGSHDPKAGGGQYGDALQLMADGREWFFPLPVPVGPVRHDRAGRRESLNVLLEELGIALPQEEYTLLVPSRVDYLWKGHDRLFEAFEQVGAAGNVRVYVTGWGRDRERALSLIGESSMRDSVTFLPCILSKPMLYRFMGGVDVVADQFSLGGHGLASLEALACGAATMAYVDTRPFMDKDFPIPPFINGHSVQALALALDHIFAGRIDVERVSRESREWIDAVHSPQVVADLVVPVLQEVADAEQH